MKEISIQEFNDILSEERFQKLQVSLNEIAANLSKKTDLELILALEIQGNVLTSILSTLQSQPKPNQEVIIASIGDIQIGLNNLKSAIEKKKKWVFKVDRDQETYLITSVTATQS